MEILQYLATAGDAAMILAALGLWRLDRRMIRVESQLEHHAEKLEGYLRPPVPVNPVPVPPFDHHK